VITSRAIDMAHLRAKEGANYVPRHLLTMSCNQSPSPAPCDVSGHRWQVSRDIDAFLGVFGIPAAVARLGEAPIPQETPA
jgi:hypothetical protein